MEPFILSAGPLLLDQPTVLHAADDRAPKPGWLALRVNENDGDPIG